MSQLLPLLAALLLAALIAPADPPRDPSAFGALLVVAAYYAAGRALAGACARPDPATGRPSATRFRVWMNRYALLALGLHAWILDAGGWSTMAAGAGAFGGEAAALAVGLAPWVALRLAGFAAWHPAARRLGLAGASLRRSIGQSLRLGSLILLPIVLLMAGIALVEALVRFGVPPFPALDDLAARYDVVSGIFTVLGLVAVFIVFPPLAMRGIGAHPMPPGPLRERLEAYADRTGLRYRDLYVWPTEDGSGILNAAVLGIVGPFRCIVITDALIHRLAPDEVEAVFAHEAGHALHHHVPKFFAFSLGYMLAATSLGDLLPASWTAAVLADPWVLAGLLLAGVLLYFGLLFGFISRRFEQEADVHGILTTHLPADLEPGDALRHPDRHPWVAAVAHGQVEPGAHPFVRSLERIATEMGGVREVTGWRHFSIADRIAFLEAYLADPDVRHAYRRRLRWLLGLMAGVLLLLLAAGARTLPVQWEGPDPAIALDRARQRIEDGDVAEARRWLVLAERGARARDVTLTRGLPTPAAPDWPRFRQAAVETSEIAATALRPSRRTSAAALEALLWSLADDTERATAAGRDALQAAREAGDPHRIDTAGEVLATVLEAAGRDSAAAAVRRSLAGP